MGGKAEKGTPKYLANKMKAKGLQKLRWYCQMCQKQCRDENGFKCHTTSESHQRQLLLFADQPFRYLDQFSREFADGYCELLKRQFGTKRVSANKVYQDYIADRDHLHMNATKWTTLTTFVKYLGREGRCTVDETEKGWFVTYIDRDPATIAKQEAANKKDKMDKDDQERLLEFIEKQVERGQHIGNSSGNSFTELKRDNEEEKIVVSLKTKTLPQKPVVLASTSQILDKRKADDLESVASKRSRDTKSEPSKKMSALESIIKEEEERKKRRDLRNNSKPSLKDVDYWLHEGIVIKVITKYLGEKYYKKKGVVEKVFDRYGGEILMLDSNDKLKLDQDHLETVIPGIGRKVLVVLGKRRGMKGEVLGLEDGGCLVKFDDGKDILEYHQVCKLK